MTDRALHPRLTATLCVLLLTFFAVTAWKAVQAKSPAYDEPYHAISSWVQLRYSDFRIDNEDPPLWQYWASLPNGKSALRADFADDSWTSMPRSVVHQWYWGVQTLYRTPGNDAQKLIARCRAMMLSCAVVLGMLICFWAWRLGGGLAAVVAALLFCLDPNFLAHSPLMKNDIAFAMSMFALVFAIWKAGQHLTISRVLLICGLCVVTLGIKFSGFVAVLLLPLMLGVRALMPGAWNVSGNDYIRRWHRLLIALSVTLIAVLFSYAGIWAMYGFRFRPTPEPNVWLNLTQLTDQIRVNEMISQYHGSVPAGVKPDASIPLAAQAAVLANAHGLLPQPFLAGFLFTYANAIVRSAYADGEISPVGWWWYFPYALVVKTPLATLLAIAIAAALAMRRRLGKSTPLLDRWTTLCLLIPVAVFLGSAMLSNLNIGIRHVLGIYPFLFVWIGVTTAQIGSTLGRKSRAAIGAVAFMLVWESLAAFPNYIAFFNSAAVYGWGSKLQLLGDSNLDWGQDLPLLAGWQKAHPDRPVYLCYFGYADPKSYGLKYIPLPGGYHYDTTPRFPEEKPYAPAVLAISATNLQGFLLDPELRDYYRKWAARKPLAVLGDTIYLYDLDPAEHLR